MDSFSPQASLDPSAIDPQVAAFLHGRLTINVIEARNVEGRTPSIFQKLERVVTSSIDGVDPYCSVKLGYNKVMQTSVIHNTEFPVWDASCRVNVCHDVYGLEFRVKAAKRSGPLNCISKVKHLSMLSIPATEIERQRKISGWFELGPYQKEYDVEDFKESDSQTSSSDEEDAVPTKGARLGEIHLSIVYEPLSEMTSPIDLSNTVPHTYFPLRCGINVKMYQDADCPPGTLPAIPYRPDFEHGRCWIDIANAIMESTGFVYITGWAVWPELAMVRTEFPGNQWKGLTLGEMLIQKAEEGVRVCIIVWDELTSNFFFKGVMGTHDEEVAAYFRHTKVIAIKAGRQNPSDGPFADLSDSAMFTHHQKTIVLSRVDQKTGKNRVEAFVGGLDVTDGRYDNQAHSLFRTLKGLHSPPDFYQRCVAVSADSGPRQPWHDIHAHVTGVAAWDILTNFEGRWSRQAPRSVRTALHAHTSETFLQPSEEDAIRDGSWNVQVLRSINETSTALSAERDGLIVRKSASTDKSIQNAYVHHIRNAKHFIYIENQYFIGSSHMWQSGQRGGFASNLVPIELSEKLCAKIRANERFVVYLVIPMFPEGAPAGADIQEILAHQRKAVELISTRVAKTLAEIGSESLISDWFNVFCLVNRESEAGNQGNGGTTPMEKLLSITRRFQIYIHSKFAIFDDTVAIIGSANINSRSLDGSRDSEIAISAWQPDHMATGTTGYRRGVDDGAEKKSPIEGSLPVGDVSAFRSSLWCEHLGEFMPEFEQPSSPECVMKIRELAEHNWQHFASDDKGAGGDMPHGHLALYPYEFDAESGEISTRQEMFPDFDLASIKGKSNPGIPNLLTG